VPTYTYEGDEGRYYSTLGLEPEPGSSHELERNPGDGRWSPPDPDPEPEPDVPAETGDTPARAASILTVDEIRAKEGLPPAKARRRTDTPKAGE
jgi:hypothetical protein